MEGARLKGHKLTISVKNTNDFDHELIEGLCNRLEEVCQCDSKRIDVTREVLKRRLTDSGSELSMLKRIVRRESLGRVQKEAKVRYLEFLGIAMEQWKGKNADGLLYLKNLAKRLRDLETFLKDESKDDGEYQVSYHGCGINYRDLFSRADAFDMLPIITEIEGSLGETTNREKGEQIFTAGVKLKLNGHVQSKESVFDYYLSILDPSDPDHQEQISESNVSRQRFAKKVLKIALLYYFVFKTMKDEHYNPATEVERDLLADLRSGDEAMQTRRLTWLKKGLSHPRPELHNQSQAAHGLKVLKDALEAFIKLPHIGPDPAAYALHLSVENGILDDDADRMMMEKEFFRTDILNEKGLGALKYISIQETDAGGDGFCTLPITIEIEPLYYFSPANERTRQFKMQYDVRGYQMLPTLFVPNDKTSQSICTQYYAGYKRIVFHYHSRLPFKHDTSEAFIYRFTFLLLSYIILKICSDSLKKRMVEQHERLFLPLVRIHKNKRTDKDDHTNEESTISALSKILSHMLAGENFSNAQGFHIDVLTDSGTNFKLTNGLSSLYTALPKTFELDSPPALDKVAVILVSSRKSDAHYSSTNYIASIYGEVIGIQRNKKGNVRVETLNTFSEYEDSSKMYRRPLAIRDQVKSCYEQGYRQILYIAQAPIPVR